MLVFKEAMQPQTAQESLLPKRFSYAEWYQKNKQRLSEKRARRYREDLSYREAALRRSREQRESKRLPITDGYTVSFADAAKELGITIWVLREWRKKDYFPEPYHREGRLWFKPEQVLLLRQLQNFFLLRGARVGVEKRKELEAITSLVYGNW